MTRHFASGITLGAFVLGTVIACGSSEDTSTSPDEDAGDGTSGGFSRPDAGSSDAGNSAADLNACATDKQQGKLAPLDLLIMQDTSGSMYGITSGTTTKWTAIKTALGSFMAAPGSADLGIGLQFFPLFSGGVPNSCLQDAECGAGRRCITKTCSNTLGKPCWSNGDCQGGGQCLAAQRCRDAAEVVCTPNVTCLLNTGNGIFNAGPCNQPLERGECENQQVSCAAADYAAVVAPIAPLPGAAAAANAALAARIPNGSTPTLGALTGAIAAARAQATANPGRVVSVVLSTDGLPGTNGVCDDAVASIEAAAAAGVAGTPSVKTFVIGVFAPQEASTATPTLNRIAAAGGTGTATILGTSATTVTDFIAALDKVRGASLPCELALPVPKAGTPDYAKVNVVFTDATTSATSLVGYVGEASACDPAKGGWYYDVKPAAGKPSKVILCPATCKTVQGAAKGTIEVVQGCETKTQDPPR
jgi:hypothetical protein